jgi:two-component system cell cycle response regulator
MNGPFTNGFAGEFLRGALDVAPEGVVICEAGGDRAVVYANSAFCRISGYELSELLGKNLRMLQGDDRDQPELDAVREALRHGEAVRALLRNVRKDGTVFVNDMQLYPLKDGDGKVTHFVGYHREGGTRPRTGDTGIRGLPTWVREDRLTGLASRYYFEDVLKRDFALAQRDKTDIALLLFDIDQLGPYNVTRS